MIRKFRIGVPLRTDAVVKEITAENGEIPYFGLEKEDDKNSFILTRKLAPKDYVYGLGENMGGINKRGKIYVSNNTDDPNHLEDKVSLYAAHNFLVIDGQKERRKQDAEEEADREVQRDKTKQEGTVGIFIDYPGSITWDIGFTHLNRLKITLQEANADIYVITAGDDMEDSAEAGISELNCIIHQFRGLVGRSYIPPRWAFGFGQSRWSYMNESEVREVVQMHRKYRLPIDMIYLDIDYMDHYKDFTVNTEAFPDFEGFCQELLAQGIHLVPIIDAGVKAEPGYQTDEEGLENGYFCTMEDGTVFEGAVWPGLAHFTDVLDSKARRWFGLKYKFLTDMGIDGFWNDMNEPALFYTKAGISRMWESLQEFKGKTNLGVNDVWAFQWAVNSLANSKTDYESFYHNLDGKRVRHDRVHNLYGYNMTRAAAEGLSELRKGKRTLLFSRSSYIGMHRYGGIWTGDNKAWWSHLLLNIKMMPSLNMCGFLYCGADLGGFGANTTEDLMLRWLEFGIFTPLMRNHTSLGSRQKECYRFDRISDFANILGIRYGLLPYIYSEYMKAALRDGMYFSTLAMQYPEDSFAPEVEDQLFVGESLMIAPVYEQNKTGRYVYLPEQMKLIRLRSMKDYDTEILSKGHHYVKAELNEVLLFIRPDHLIPVSSGGFNTEEVDFEHVDLWGYVVKEASYEYYCDDGISQVCDKKQNIRIFRLDFERHIIYNLPSGNE